MRNSGMVRNKFIFFIKKKQLCGKDKMRKKNSALYILQNNLIKSAKYLKLKCGFRKIIFKKYKMRKKYAKLKNAEKFLNLN